METMNETDDLALPGGFSSKTGGKSFEWRKLSGKEDDQLIERVLPAYGKLVEKGDFGVYRKLHNGWNGKNSTDPSKVTYKPFACVEERRNKMVVRECPACKLTKEYEQKVADLEAEEKKQAEVIKAKAAELKATPAQLTAQLDKNFNKYRDLKKAAKDWLATHWVDKKFLMPTVNEQDVLSVTSIPWGMASKLKAEKDKIENNLYPPSIANGREVKIQAIGRVGVFFEFNRKVVNGQVRPENDIVTTHMKQGADGSFSIAFHRASNELLKRVVDSMPDLVDLVNETVYPYESVEKLIEHTRECGGSHDPDVVDAILNKKTTTVAPTKSLVDAMPTVKKTVVGDSSIVTKASTFTKTEVAEVSPTPDPKVDPAESVDKTPVAINQADVASQQFEAMFA